MNGQREDMSPSCCLHPDAVFVGVCPLCLNERLLVLAANRRRPRRSTSSQTDKAHRHRRPPTVSGKKATINMPKIFAIGSLLTHLEFRYRRTDGLCDASSSTEDDSFISIKFEDNGVASWPWEKNPESKVSLGSCNIPWIHWNPIRKVTAFKDAKATASKMKSVVEHSKPQAESLRWRERIGHLFHLIRRKRSGKAGSVCHQVVGVEVKGVKLSNGWMRALTKTRAKQ